MSASGATPEILLLARVVKLVDTADLKSAAYSKEGVSVRFRSRAPLSMRLFKPSIAFLHIFLDFGVAQSLHKKPNTCTFLGVIFGLISRN